MNLLLILCLLVRVVNLSDVSFYEILGISKQATAQEIRQAYKKLAIKYHPDKNPNESEKDKFLKITEAYETLKDPDKRHKYDVYGSYPTYTKKYDYQSQAEYNNLYYNGLYHNDPNVDTLSGNAYYNYLQNNGFHFVNFYSPFCPPCQNLVEHWKRLAETYKGVVKVGAVNCKYYNSFCYNSMRISSYPSLLFYPYGKNGNYIHYRGDRTFEALDKFVMQYLRSQVHVPTVNQLKQTQNAVAYVLGANRIEENALLRIAHQLKGLVTFMIVEDETLRAKLTKDEYTTIVFKYKDTSKHTTSTEEKDILKQIVGALPGIETIVPDKLKKIRSQLRQGHRVPWLLYFSSQSHGDRLLLYQLRLAYPDYHFGEIDCEKYMELCMSLQIDTPPAFGVLKPGGAYQLLPDSVDIRQYLPLVVEASGLHSLSASDLVRILDGDVGTWVLLVAPYKLSWDHLLDPFTRASLHYIDDGQISFGIMSCTFDTDKYCRQLASQPAVIIQSKQGRQMFNGRAGEEQLVEFVQLVKESADLILSEEKVLDIISATDRSETWLLAFLPPQCGINCDQLLHEWRIVANKLRALEYVRVGARVCARAAGLCANVRAATARLYIRGSAHHYTVSLDHLSQAPYMLEWALEYITDSVVKHNWHSFTHNVIAEELNPTSGKKPWLVYFHSPRCYRCYEMLADFTVAGILLNNAVQLGKVNCMNERGLCQNEQVTSYPSLKLYLNRNQHHTFSSVINIPVRNYANIMEDVRRHLVKYDHSLLENVHGHGMHVSHDEL